MKILCGDPGEFAIECEICGESEPPAHNALGDVWFWISGKRVGNENFSTIGIAAQDLESTLKYCGKRYEAALYVAEGESVVSEIYYNAYERRFEGDLAGSLWRSDRFMICMNSSGNEWTDGWIFVLIEAGEPGNVDGPNLGPDRILYRGPDRETHEVWWPRGTYERVVKDFLRALMSNSTYRPSVSL